MTFSWSQQRILILSPHPDDETLGCGGLIHKAKSAGAEVFVQFLTVGNTTDQSSSVFSSPTERNDEIKRVAAHVHQLSLEAVDGIDDGADVGGGHGSQGYRTGAAP